MEFIMNEEGFQSDFEFGTLKVSSNDQFGFRPYALLVSSVAVCSGGVLRKILEKKRISFDDIKISADVKRNPDIANRVEEIKLHFTIIGNDISEDKVEKAMNLTRKNCSMIQSVQDSIHVVETFEIKNV
ncbi:OsmC family protein [Oceanobacillus halophilus]|uniref:OsmC family peroxiredoxin n=1 Tax=Oceanobacillus halophilus TaxID=930130 RepID=A0A495A2I7_9BACI|nr:OsmC family protein [Oceanobacillus halophilus]RKQ33556.1 OsmC family peroxiredoxin [Oceanobacillus halophilus]